MMPSWQDWPEDEDRAYEAAEALKLNGDGVRYPEPLRGYSVSAHTTPEEQASLVRSLERGE